MQIRVKELVYIRWRELEPLQPDNAKLPENEAALEITLRKYGIAQPFYIWQHKGKNYAVDGHTRKKVLMRMEDVPEELPATPIAAKNRKEAIKILLDVYNQKHNPFDGQVLLEMLEAEEILVDEIAMESIHIAEEKSSGASDEQEEDEEEKRIWTPDCLFPSNNAYDIPTLLVQAGLSIVEAALAREAKGEFVTLELSDDEQINRDCASEYLNEVDLLEHPEDYQDLGDEEDFEPDLTDE